MSLPNAQPYARPGISGLWLRLAAKALVRLAHRAPPIATPERSPAASRHIVGVRKFAICKDARGQLRRIDLILPVDLVRDLSRPLDIEFLDGGETVTAEILGKAIRSNFQQRK